MKKGFEDRKYTRIQMKVEVQMEKICNGEKRMGKTECVSMNGLFIDCKHPYPIGEECHITLFIGEHGSERRVQVKGRVVYNQENGMGIEILSHLCMESYDHLHRLVLYNAADDADRVEEEIETRIHQDTTFQTGD